VLDKTSAPLRGASSPRHERKNERQNRNAERSKGVVAKPLGDRLCILARRRYAAVYRVVYFFVKCLAAIALRRLMTISTISVYK